MKKTDAMWDDSPVNVTEEVNFIWSIANKLRGPYQSDKYKDVIIPMTIIRRLECALSPYKKAVVDYVKKSPSATVLKEIAALSKEIERGFKELGE